ncbi:hypothetical protein N7510_001534 [Penicillium lagena]|uniref:uncharacterized protein n=1 Tax=Penicillium lagena TaxID=94218 RepID=UPI0025414E9D|nr:uncharacterized protein N7510_001534 [Penicillium lagena]KAJ5625225.1 hypothetical protein N7510_001534 [Penicillium lagena]
MRDQSSAPKVDGMADARDMWGFGRSAPDDNQVGEGDANRLADGSLKRGNEGAHRVKPRGVDVIGEEAWRANGECRGSG